MPLDFVVFPLNLVVVVTEILEVFEFGDVVFVVTTLDVDLGIVEFVVIVGWPVCPVAVLFRSPFD